MATGSKIAFFVFANTVRIVAKAAKATKAKLVYSPFRIQETAYMG